MLNYYNLDDIEFEELCKDIMQKILNRKLRTFGKGKDGGIDLKDNIEGYNIVVQVKHYINSSISSLMTSLNKEVKKVKKLNPNKYYVCCSKELSSAKVTEIYNLFKDYMESENNIFTLKEIDDFLQNPINVDIVRKHFKLWLESSNILSEVYNQNIFIDCEVLLYDIKEEYRFYVQTKLYNESLETLEKDRTLMLIGSPGVGKTTTSKMLILYYASEGYRVRYTTNGAISDIKNAISIDKNVKEIILLDDCLGQYYFKMKDTQENELITLIKYIKTNPNKILVLNSRVTIFNEAKEHSLEFYDFITNKKISIKCIDMDKISALEKAKILYNNLYFNKIPQSYYQSIRDNKNYFKIVNHPNYNPRIIEYVTQPVRYNEITSDEYYNFILDNLNNPKDVWKNEFTKRMTSLDRIFMFVLFSLTDTNIRYETLNECFNKRVQLNKDIDTSIDNFKITLNRLNKSMIKIVDNSGRKEIGVLNPSINDYLKVIFWENDLELSNIRKSIIYYEQIKRCYKGDEIGEVIRDKIYNGSILELKMEVESEYGDVENLLLYNICIYGILNKSYISNVNLFFENIFKYRKKRMGIINKLLEEPLYSYYRIEECISNIEILTDILEAFDNEELISLIKIIYDKLISNGNEELLEEFENICFRRAKENIDSYIEEFENDKLLDDLDINDFFCESTDKIKNIGRQIFNDEFEFQAAVIDDVANALKEELKFIMKEKLNFIVEKFPIVERKDELNNYISEFIIDQYVNESAIESAIESYMEPDYYDDRFDDDYNEEYNDSEIDYIFDR